MRLRLSERPPSLLRWILRGTLVGFAVGVAAIAIGYWLSWRADNMEPLEVVFWWMMIATAPLSFALMALAEAAPAAIGAWLEFFLAFVIMPIVQGAVVALLLWSADWLIRRRRSSRATV